MEYWTEQQLSSIDKMLNPRSIAVVGATERMQYGGRFLRSVLRAGEGVRVYPVNPRYGELMGLQCYASVIDLPESPDLVGIIVPHHRVIPVLQESAEKGAGSGIVISAGFSERAEEDRVQLQIELGNVARDTGVRISGPNCLGLANIKSGMWACSSSSNSLENLTKGNIGLVCQSGASAFGPFLSRAISRGIGYSYIISTGNEADLEASDFVRYLLDDDDTKVIAMFVEGFKDARKFLEVARLAAERGKPIVLIKIGRSGLGMQAAKAHTASLTGADDVFDAAFKQFGVTRVNDWDQLLEVSQMLADSPPPYPNGIAVISHSGGVCSLTADAFGNEGLELPELSDDGKNVINEILAGFGWAGNPADITGHASRDTVELIMETLISEPEVGALVVASSASDEQAQHVIDVASRHEKPIAYLHTGNELGAPTGLDTLKGAGIPVFYSPENLASAFRKLHDYHYWREQTLNIGFGTAPIMSEAQLEITDELRKFDRIELTDCEAKRVLSNWGVATTGQSDVPGIVGAEVIIGVSQDDQLGPILSYRMGGALAEIMTDVALRICPISRQEAQKMVDEVPGSRVLFGLADQLKGDIDTLIDTLVSVSGMAINLEGTVADIGINSLVVHPEGEGVTAHSVMITLRKQQ
jgi:acetyltransferase